jgi:hypothetical protein
MSWHNPITGVQSYGNFEFNFVFKNGETSTAPMSKKTITIKSITPRNSVVRVVLIHYNMNDFVKGFEFYDSNKTLVLGIGYKGQSSKEILLEADDRIVGFKSRLHNADEAKHNSLVLVIARRTS